MKNMLDDRFYRIRPRVNISFIAINRGLKGGIKNKHKNTSICNDFQYDIALYLLRLRGYNQESLFTLFY